VAGRGAGASEIVALVTSPGRQSTNGAELAAAVGSATGISVRLLTADEEGRLAYRGARDAIDGTVLVGDIGGGSVQIAAGDAREHPVWAFSANVGSLRLTRRHVRHDPPRRGELKAMRQTAGKALAQIGPTDAAYVLVTGGTARALRRLTGGTLGQRELEAVIELLGRHSARKLARSHGLSVWRAETLPAGAILAHTLSDRLQRPLEVADNGIREGAIIDLLENRPENRPLDHQLRNRFDTPSPDGSGYPRSHALQDHLDRH
jgi:exopolyphosphatase/guanosine-5'-triphosphate,3'-diphosphate pyrophosphatase